MDPHLFTLVLAGEAENNVFTYILLLIILIACNAFFASSELAIVSLNDAKLEKMAEEGNKKAKMLVEMTNKPTTFLSTIQIGVTLSGFLSSAIAADTFADYIVALFTNTNISLELVRMISIVLITILLSFVTLVFGELLPKRIAMKDPEKVAFKVVGPIKTIYIILKPIVFLVSKTVSGLANMLGIKETDGQAQYSEEEIRIMVDASNEKGYIENEQKDMINNIFEFNDRTVGEIMIHRMDMESLSLNDDLDTVMKTFMENGHSRIPVFEHNIDDIVGVLYVKDLLQVLLDDNKKKKFKVKDYLREPLFVYENMKCDDLFDQFQAKKVQLAIVLDEYGGTYGLVTMEDLLESIVGDIQDEYDDEEEEIEELTDTHFIVDGAALISDVSKEIEISLDDSENDTIGGLLMDKLGYVPEEDEHPVITIDNVTFKIVSMDEKSIDKVDITVNKQNKE